MRVCVRSECGSTVELMKAEADTSGHRTAVVSFKTLDQAIAAYDEISDTVRIVVRTADPSVALDLP